jgi:histidinol-phosphatase
MSALREALETVARLAGDHALQFFRQPIDIVTKQDGSPVTRADKEAEQKARAWLEAHFPEDGVLGEEFGESNPKAARRWLIDPIDGTKAFVAGVPLWGTLVAVCEGETVLAGAAYFPALGECLTAVRGEGCFLNGAVCRVSTVDTLRQATVLTTEAKTSLAGLQRLQAQAAVSRTWGDCYGYLLVATGRAEAMVDPVLNDWDSAAFLPIIEEAGGVFTSIDGRRTAFGKSAIATNRNVSDTVRRFFALPATGVGFDIKAVDFSKGAGLVPVVTQHALSGEVLMLAYIDAEALQKTVETGLMHYRSRSRGLWFKGETSGHTQRVISLHLDCDQDTILARVIPNGPACHNNTPTCFADAPPADALTALDCTVALRKNSPVANSYTNKLLANRNLRLKKLGEETAELVVALCDNDTERAAEEAADVCYHVLVALHAAGLSLDDVRRVLHQRSLPTQK